jgi:hypothetical protein
MHVLGQPAIQPRRRHRVFTRACHADFGEAVAVGFGKKFGLEPRD